MSQRWMPTTKGAEIDLPFAAFAIGAEWRNGVVDVGGLAGVEVGSQGGQGFGVTQPGDGHQLWLAASATVTLRRRLAGRWNVVGAAGAVIPLLRPRFVIENLGVVHQASAAALRW